jgi:hypothetical protein
MDTQVREKKNYEPTMLSDDYDVVIVAWIRKYGRKSYDGNIHNAKIISGQLCKMGGFTL